MPSYLHAALQPIPKSFLGPACYKGILQNKGSKSPHAAPADIFSAIRSFALLERGFRIISSWPGVQRPAGHQRHCSTVVTSADRLSGRTDAVLAFQPKILLHNPILQRMKRNHRKPAAWSQGRNSLRQNQFQTVQLFIDCDPQGLKRPGSRMMPALTDPGYLFD